jgi:hypothetical protein
MVCNKIIQKQEICEKSRKVDANDYFDELLGQIYLYQNDGPFFICGDFNSRVGDLHDFDADLDDVCERNVTDFKVNAYGRLFIDLLISSSCCMLNGRNYTHNDYTSVSSKGKAVVDYCFTSHENLSMLEKFNVINAKDVFEEAGCIGRFDPTVTSIPDHSVLTWSFICNQVSGTDDVDDWSYSFDKFDRNVPENFMISKVDDINKLINNFKVKICNQNLVDDIYLDFCTVLKDEMYTKMEYKNIKANSGTTHKKCRRHKPWWSDKLSNQWRMLRDAEKHGIKLWVAKSAV